MFLNVSFAGTKYFVPNMVCQDCANSITKSLKKNKRIKTVNFDVPKKTFSVIFSEGSKELTPEEIKAVSEDVGYSIITKKVKAKALQ